ncbi:MAG: hypothetical protein E7408_05775 [Ruminococcaceae bacterium]|nr:hypothetical protein [Oscillospiraceae bacterium]
MNDRLRHLLTLVIGLPLCFAVGISVVLLLIRLDGTLRTLAILFLFAVAITTLIFVGVRNSRNNKLVGRLLDILYKEVHPDRFIEESLAALKKTRNRALKNTLSLNLAVGYAAAGKFDEAIDVMKSIPIGSADKVSKAMFYCNAAAFYAEKGATAEANEAYNMGRPYFEKAEAKLPMGYLRFTRGLLHYAEGQFAEALEALEKARGIGFEDRHTMTNLQLFEARSLVRLEKTREAKALYAKIIQKKTYPFLLSCAKTELEQLKNEEI